MPFYEYECESCKFYSEVMQKISDAPLTKCPSCGRKTLRKLVSAPNFRLKGGGWYETDFKGDQESKRNLAGAEKEETKPEAAGQTEAKAPAESRTAEPAKADSKPEAKPAPGPAKAEPKISSSGYARGKVTPGRSVAPAARAKAGRVKALSRTKARPSARKKAKR